MFEMKSFIYLAVIFVVFYLGTASVAASSVLPLRKFNLRDSSVSYEPSSLQSDGDKDGKDHPCFRPCDGRPMRCFYHFQVEWYQSMSKACFDCPFNITDCGKEDCVVADGLGRQLMTINRKLPAPTIAVCHSDQVIVNVTNDLGGTETTIHWHGMHQRGTPYMDGVPFLTQCPISPESTFTYEFTAAQAGTHFYHAHIGLQRGDGISGALIVRKPRSKEPYRHLFDKDEPEHLIEIIDWSNRSVYEVYASHYHSNGGMAPTSVLINGRGRFEVKNKEGKTAMTKPPRFDVTRGTKYRFRVINEGFSYCPMELSVDEHTITIIATDGYYLEPIVARSLVTYAGERFDFIINTNKKVANYWIKVRGILNCENELATRQVAVLHYRGADDGDPSGPEWEPRIADEMQINSENQGEEQNTTMTISKLKYMKSIVREDDTLKAVPDYKFYVAFDLYRKDNEFFNKPPYYGHGQVNKDYSVPTPQLNHISMKLPSSPLLVTRPSSDMFCNESSFKEGECKSNFCRCHHILSVDLNSVVEVILIDEGKFLNANHPFHLHGHSFRVIGQKQLNSKGVTVEEVKAEDRAGRIYRNLKNRPPYKDTVTVPDGGYTVIRFKACNPGYWLFHCHIEFHAEVGMALGFKVGEHEDMAAVPQGFPTCGDFGNNGGSAFTNGGLLNLNQGLLNQGMSPNNVFANVVQQYNAYHSIVQMPMGGQMEIIYKPAPTES